MPNLRVIIESPYAGDVERNVAYAKVAMLDCLKRGEAPFASHLLYTQVLNDLVGTEREMGIGAGFRWLAVADKSVVYTDLGMSNGMKAGIAAAQAAGKPVEYRTIPDWQSVAVLVLGKAPVLIAPLPGERE